MSAKIETTSLLDQPHHKLATINDAVDRLVQAFAQHPRLQVATLRHSPGVQVLICVGTPSDLYQLTHDALMQRRGTPRKAR